MRDSNSLLVGAHWFRKGRTSPSRETHLGSLLSISTSTVVSIPFGTFSAGSIVGNIVNRTSDVAGEWEKHVVWIRMNVAYITAELPDLSASGHDVSDLEALLTSFESVFEQFCRSELDVFVAARASEVSDSERLTLIGNLRRTRESFRSWLQEYHGIVEKTRAAGPPDLPLILLLACGSELMKAQNRFADVIDAYVRELEG